MSDRIRYPVAAGRFYPADAQELRDAIRGYLADSPPVDLRLRGLIVPHAGYVYSGPVAASGYAVLARDPAVRDGRVRRVVLAGTCHTAGVRGVVTSSDRWFRTPLGDVEVDRPAVDTLLRTRCVTVHDAAQRRDHALEVQLPFLQEVLGAVTIVPLLVGRCDAQDAADVFDPLWDEQTLLLVSTDLSHYLPYQAAARLDSQTARCIEQLDDAGIGPQQACGYHAVRGALAAARRHGLAARTLGLRNSGDTAGPRDSVVGYGAFALYEPWADDRAPSPPAER